MEIGEPLGVENEPSGSVEGRWRVDDRAVDEFAVVGVHGCWLMVVGWLAGLLVCWNADRLRDTQSFDRNGVARPLATASRLGFASGNLIASRQAHSDGRALEFSFLSARLRHSSIRSKVRHL